MAQVQVRDTEGRGVPNINIRIALGHGDSDAAIFDYETDDAGNQGWPIPFWPAQAYTLHVNKRNIQPGYGEAERYVPVPVGGQYGDIVIPLAGSGAGSGDGGESGFLHTYGHESNLVYGFATEDNKPWQFIGYSAYLLVSCVKKGEDIVPFIKRAQSYGANTLVTLGAALSDWCVLNGFGFDPREQATKDAIAKTFDICAGERMRVCHLVASDFQGLSDSEKTHVWNEQCDIMAGRWNLLAACGKEQNVNGWHPSLFPVRDLRGVLQSAGSAGEGVAPLQPARDFSLWETRNHLDGAGWHKVLDDAGAGMFEQNAGYGGFPATKCPIVMIEGLHLADTNPDHVGDKRETDPEKALQFGLQVGASCAGGVVLTSLGQEGKLDGDVAAHCAREQIRGMKAAFLR